MSATRNRPHDIGPTPIDSGAVENLQYIRRTIEAAHTFTTVPGKGCIAMGITALAAVAAESYPPLTAHWLAIWVGAAVSACALALYFMEQKAHAQGLSLRRAVARRFFMTLAPAFLSGAILTAALVGRVDRRADHRRLVAVVRHRPHGLRVVRRSGRVHRWRGVHGARHGHALVAARLGSRRARAWLRRHPSGARRRHREAPRWLSP